MAKKNKKFPKYLLRADVSPDSIDKEKRTVEVIFGTDEVIRRRNYRGTYREQLSFDPAHVNMKRLESGRAPLLDNHDYWKGVKASVLGVVVSSRIEDGRGYAVVKFSQRADVADIWQDVQDGILRNISVGYNVFQYEHTVNEDGPDLYRAIDWEPVEVSLVPIPADNEAYVRAATAEDAIFQNVSIIQSLNTKSIMAKKNKPEIKDGDEAVLAGAPNSRGADPKPTDTPAGENEDDPAPAPVPQKSRKRGAEITPEMAEAATAAVSAERKRALNIRKAVATANLDASFADDLIGRGISIDAARQQILDKWAEDGGPTTRANQGSQVVGEDELDKKRAAIGDSILHRAGHLTDADGKPVARLEGKAAEYRNLSLLDLGRELLEDGGTNTRGMDRQKIATLALTTRGAMSTSDFPLILGNIINRSLRAAYALAPRTFVPFSRRVNVSDFRKRTTVQLSQLMKGFDEVKEGGEYKMDTFTEGGEEWKVTKYGRIIPVTWETLINDDLDAFGRIPMAMANAAAQKQSDIVWGILLSNPQMADGTALFHSSHGNLASPASALSVDSLGKARAAFRKQTGLNKKDFLNLMASYLMVGPDVETKAGQILNGVITPNTTAEVNPFQSSYNLIVEPRITGNNWFMAAAPTTIDTIEYGFLDGNELYTEQKEGFEIDGMQVKARMVFGAKAIDHRGLYKNAGA